MGARVMVDVVVPYRDRAPQLQVLIPALLTRNIRRVLVAEQAAGAPFNRGAVKNAGFAALAPDDGDTVYFHDVDLLPGAKLQAYPPALVGACVHLYGHRHCLGGVIGVRALDFAAVGGFQADWWKWGGEDRDLQRRWLACGLTIDRSAFWQRFTDNGWLAELDDAGRPLSPARARNAFLASCRPGGARRHTRNDLPADNITCPLAATASYAIIGHGPCHGAGDGRVVHLVFDVGSPSL